MPVLLVGLGSAGEKPGQGRGQGGGVDVVLLALQGLAAGVGDQLDQGVGRGAEEPEAGPLIRIRVGTGTERASSAGMV
jgi:hypothetical protein